jgi:Stage II sporulation protein M
MNIFFLNENSKTLRLICLLSWILGVIICIVLYKSVILNIKPIEVKPFSINVNLIKLNYFDRFIKIYSHNLSIGLLLFIGGFITGGFISLVILIYNGFISTSIIINAILAGKGIVYFIKNLLLHGFFEIASFIEFGSLGLYGFIFWKLFIKSQPVNIRDLITIKKIIIPFLLLLFAALIESI